MTALLHPEAASSAPPGMAVTLDPARMQVDEAGLADFFWPVAQDELTGFRDLLHDRLAAAARAADQGDGLDGELLRAAMPGFLYRAMGLFEVAALASRAALQGHVLEPPAHSIGLGPLLRGEQSVDHVHDVRQRLIAPFAPEPLWRSAGRVLRNRLTSPKGAVPHRRLWEIDPRRGIVTLALGGSISRQIAAAGEPVVYCHPRDWFPGSAVPAADAPGCAAFLIDDMMQAVVESAARFGTDLPESVTDCLRRYLSEVTALGRHHVERLLTRPRRLPKRLWLVSGVTAWARPLIAAVRLNGGEITGHEHGTGESWAARCGDTLFEFDVLDRFVCYSLETARQSAEQQATGPLAREGRCEMLGLTPERTARPAAGRRAQPARPNVMLVSSFYRGDIHMRYKPGLPDPVAVDWQARLLGRLRRWGYEPIYRPHPEQREPWPRGLVETFGVPVAEGSFRNAAEAADILLFDFPLTSAWRDALCLGRPVVLVDFGQSSLSAEARALADGRMAIVAAGFDAENRAALDWEALRAALARAPELDDPRFVEAYFGHA